MVKRALDSGAHGVLVPLIYSADDAKRLVESTKFPPRGKRGFGSPFSMGAFDSKGDLSGLQYMQNANDNLLTIIQIETASALADVENIAKIDGIDVLFVGPWDLGNNIGHPVLGDFDQELKDAITRVREAAKAAGKWSGIYCPNGDVARKYADEGFQMISVINDMTAIPVYMTQSLNTAKGTWGHSAAQAVKGAAYGAVNLASRTSEDKP
ncbi:hypothetical protein LTR51_004879 [Lithohypha guttulata]|uniref:HpcH/HpaI aldolase/citrate lyase domain-containing protein n=2 Tax=Lithohypha guttulata TaxID=1690604 RepID=A0AAN7YLM8_9EURO|nr:hypothetical protein LTR51_004879 [Lithohypha guttulata]KAK5091486.1 hypothetical protein LTR05_001670 [Lithohypha guttulata]